MLKSALYGGIFTFSTKIRSSAHQIFRFRIDSPRNARVFRGRLVTLEWLCAGQSKPFTEFLLETGADPFKIRTADKVYVRDDPATMGRVAPSEYGRQVSHGGVLDNSLPHRVERFDR